MKPRRRRVLAAPFVVTAVLSPACGSRQASDTTPTTAPAPDPAPAEPSADGDEPAPDPAPEGKGAWAKDQAGRWIYSYEAGGQEVRYEGGRCELRYIPDCPPDATCNPPAPRAVACPDGLPDEARE